jgi:hypothetical protein
VPLRRRASCLALVVATSFAVSSSGAHAGPRAKPTKQECVAANESAQDLQNAGRLLDAETQLQTCIDKACPAMVREDCAERLRQVSAAIPTVVFLLRDPDGLDVGASAVVEMDGAPWPAAIDGTPIPIDPGEHTFTFTVAGRPPVTRRISFRAGERLRRDVQMKAEPQAEQARPAPAPVDELGPVTSPAKSDLAAQGTAAGSARPASSMPPERAVAIATLGAGGAGLVLSFVFGAVGLAKKGSLLSACPGNRCPSSQEAQVGSFNEVLVAGNVAFVAGLAGIVAGTGLLFLWPPQPTSPSTGLTVSLWVGVASAGVGGSFR